MARQRPEDANAFLQRDGRAVEGSGFDAGGQPVGECGRKAQDNRCANQARESDQTHDATPGGWTYQVQKRNKHEVLKKRQEPRR